MTPPRKLGADIPVCAIGPIPYAVLNAFASCRGSRTSTSDRVLVFTPGAPAVQILVSAMRALDRSKLVLGLSRGRLASRWWESNGNDSPARLVLAHPAEVEITWDHLMRNSDVDMAQAQ